MRWKNPYIGDEKVVNLGFLFFPKTINNETRWWEKAHAVMRYEYIMIPGLDGSPVTEKAWEYIIWEQV